VPSNGAQSTQYQRPSAPSTALLRSHLKSLGVSLRSATEPIDDTSTGKLMEGVLASFAQFDNDVRSDRTRAGMKAVLELGRWTFLAPIGYINVPRTYGKSLIPDPERAPVVQQIVRDFATRFTKQELLDEMTRRGLKTRRDCLSVLKRSAQCCRTSCTSASWTPQATA